MREHIRSNIVGYVAVFLALTGTATALKGKNTVDSGDIKPANVKSSDLAPDSVDSSKVIDNSLTGADIDEGALGQVPSAASANQANNATTSDSATQATTAGDANLLDGLNSTDFLRSNATAGGGLTGTYPDPAIAPNAVAGANIADGAVTSAEISDLSITGKDIGLDSVGASHLANVDVLFARSSPAFCDDAVGGGETTCSTLHFSGGFMIIYTCSDGGSDGRTAEVFIEEANTGQAWALDSEAPGGASDQTGLAGADGIADRRRLASVSSLGAHFQGGDFVALTTDANGQHVLAGEVAVGTSVFGHDCAAVYYAIG